MTIVKTKRGYEVISHKAHRCMGIYKSKSEAQARIEQIERQKERFMAMVRKRKRGK